MMKTSIGAGIAALVAGATLAASPALAQFHGGGHMGGGFHAGGMRGGGFNGGMRGGAFNGGMRGGAFNSGMRSGSWNGHWHHGGDHDHDFFFFGGFWPGFGFWDPFWWDGGYVGGYALAPYGYYDGYAPPPPASAAPSGYDCDGWRWDKQANRYVAAKVSCQ